MWAAKYCSILFSSTWNKLFIPANFWLCTAMAAMTFQHGSKTRNMIGQCPCRMSNPNRWEFCRSMRDRTNACVPRDVSRDKRGKFCKHLKGFKTKINRMNEENFAAFFVLLAFIELSFAVTSLTGETNSNKRETRALAEQKNGKAL